MTIAAPHPDTWRTTPTAWTLETAHAALRDQLPHWPLELPARFTFAWRSGHYDVSATEDGAAIRLVVTGAIGALPFSSENRQGRSKVLAALVRLRKSWPRAGLTLTGNRVELHHELHVKAPMGFPALMGAVSESLLSVLPAIEAIEADLMPV
ncbi:hypothetical protein [Parapedomonas caeni]